MTQLPTGWISLAGFLLLLAFQAWQVHQGGKVKSQVTNGGSNLAATVGEIKAKVEGMGKDIQGLREDVGGLRGELRAERQARGDLEQLVERRLRHG